ncbi:MAG: ASKHA domain-containing protein [Firmicutes bacterium]|nr:ASKHA domain-containing protein [Bacillota bacterium]
MKKIQIEKFDIKINKESVLGTLGCFRESSVYDTVSEYFDELENEVYGLISPRAVMAPDGMRAYCLLTLGEKISEYSKAFFDNGEGMKGLLADAMADEYIFAMDNILAERIKYECAVEGYGVKKRLDAPKDIPLSQQEVILEKTGIDGVGLTSAFMFEPAKTFGYIIEFTLDERMFNAQHNCEECGNFNCPRRSVSKGGAFNVLSGYEYKPSVESGKRAVCIDIGTTTVAFELISERGTDKTYKTINPQRRFGLDVLSRIEAANRGRNGELASMIRYTLISGYKEVTKGTGDADIAVIAGNTAMVHLLMDYSCASLGKYPFKSEHLDTIKTTFDALTNSKTAPVPTVVCGGISAFVGGDIVSGLYMCDFDKSEKTNMFIDLGTNGEMAVGNRRGITATSTAAGPAFEGGRISCGVGSVDGAVCGVDLKSGKLKTIGNKPPIGLCGTGIIELVSELLDAGIINNTGLLADDYFTDGYRVADDIVFTQNDIRQVQMAKAAVRAGIEALAKERKTDFADIDTVYLAGGFGYGLDIDKACNIGILPTEFKGKTKVIGNSSLGGCAKYCSENDGDERILHIKNISSEISLGNNPDFERLYIEYMNF